MEEVKQFRLRHRPDDTLKIRWAGGVGVDWIQLTVSLLQDRDPLRARVRRRGRVQDAALLPLRGHRQHRQQVPRHTCLAVHVTRDT